MPVSSSLESRSIRESRLEEVIPKKMSKDNEVAVGCVSGASVMYRKIYVGYERPSKWFTFLKALIIESKITTRPPAYHMT
jgi:hypothetical protein